MRYSVLSVRDLTLIAISDDYENIEWICEEVSREAEVRGLVASRKDILNGIKDLIEGGFAQAYLLSSEAGRKPAPVKIDDHALAELWFYATAQGLQLIDQLPRAEFAE